jgi:hypothetical protein
MSLARDMLEASPASVDLGAEAVAAAIEAAMTCAQACTSCADSCLAEKDVAEFRRCIALCVTSADVCAVTVRLLSRPYGSEHAVTHRGLTACVRACTSSAEECERHAAHHRHCALCAKACRACVQACRALLDAEAFKELEKLAGA